MLIGSLVELLACCFDLLVFFLLEKLLFFKLDNLSIDPRQIQFLSRFLSSASIESSTNFDPSRYFPVLSAFSIESRQIFNPSRFLGHFSIEV